MIDYIDRVRFTNKYVLVAIIPYGRSNWKNLIGEGFKTCLIRFVDSWTSL